MKRQGIALTIVLAGCTPGGITAPTAGGSKATSNVATTTVDINLTLHSPAAIAAGTGGGYAPLVATVAAGSAIRFVNSDNANHTATSVTGSTFPAASPFSLAAQSASGGTLSGGWSTGTLLPGAASAPVLADAPGTYLYGCFFHYPAPMRAEIVVR